MTTELSVKVVYDGEMRRFSFSGTSFQALRDKIVELLGLGATPIVVKYIDEDGDLITVSSDLELRAAIVPGKLLRLEISLKQPTAQIPPQQPAPPPSVPPTDAAPFNPFAAFQRGCGPTPMQAQAQPQPQPYIPPHHRPFGTPFGSHWDNKADMKDDWRAMKEHHKAMKAHVKGVHKAMKTGKYPPHPHPHHHMFGGPLGFAPSHPPGFAPSPSPGVGAVPPFHPTQNQEKLVARHVKDITIEDGTRIPAGTSFVKTWRVRNEGAPWPAGCQLAYNSCEKNGTCDNMSGPEYVVIGGPVASNVEIDIAVPLVAPTKPGRYTGYWKMRTPDGKKFGQRLWVTIVVPSGGSSSDEEADKYEALVDIVMAMGFDVKRHRVFRLLQKHNGDVQQVALSLAEKQQKAEKKAAKREQWSHQQPQPQYGQYKYPQQSNISMID